MGIDVRGEPADLDAAWMTAVLDATGVADGAQVVDLQFESFIGTGQTGRNARFSLTWDEPDGRPASVVGKFPSGDENARTSAFTTGTYLTEVSFYRELAPTLDIRIPECHLAGLRPRQARLRDDHGGSRRLAAGRPVHRAVGRRSGARRRAGGRAARAALG